MDKLNIGIVGVGRIGQRHASIVHDLANLDAVCDIDEELVNFVSSKYGCNGYHSISDLLKNEWTIDLLSICTPNGYHAE